MTHNFETIEGKITNVIYKHHRYFYNNRETDVQRCGDLKLEISPITFGDLREGVDYKLYFSNKLVSEIGYDYEEYRYGDFETISDKDEFVKQLDMLDVHISIARDEAENVSNLSDYNL